jgi:hypothetical protein
MVRENAAHHEGRKYLRILRDCLDRDKTIQTDVYGVLVGFQVTCPAIGHAIKKLLCPGQRDKGSRLADLVGAMAALNRAIELEEDFIRENTKKGD